MATSRAAFVMMPFSQDFDDVYQSLIREPLISAGYEVSRSDDFQNQTNILRDIVHSIVECNLVVADLTSANPNVYYELGIAHTLHKPVVLLAQDLSAVPFDLRSYRIINYSTHFSKMNEAISVFTTLLRGIDAGTVLFGNPVSDFASHGGMPSNVSPVHSPSGGSGGSDLGLLDYQASLEEGAEVIGCIMSEVGKRFNVLTPELRTGSERLRATQTGTKERRSTMQGLAKSIDDYAVWLNGANTRYKAALADISNALVAMLSGEFKVDDENKDGLRGFVATLQKTELQAQSGRESFCGLVLVIEGLPRIEKEFSRANRRLVVELKELVGNVDQTISVFSRARNAALQLIGSEI